MNLEKHQILDIHEVSPEEFFELIDRNREHLAQGFPTTIRLCSSIQKTAELVETYQEWHDNIKGFSFFIKNKELDKFVAHVNIKNIDQKLKKCELGYFADKDFTGQGITSSAVDHIVTYCFEKLQMNKIFICTDPHNIGSQKVALSNGFKKEGVLREEFRHPDGRLLDVVYFGKLRSEHHT